MSPTISDAPADTASGVRFRASDAERMAVAEVLQDAVGRGLLTPAEGSERTAAAFAAVYRDDFTPLTADLPPDRPAGAAGRGRTSGRGWWVRARAAAEKLWLAALAMFSAWSPRRRLAVAVVVGVLLIPIGVALGSFDGGGPRGGRGGGPGGGWPRR
jgi:hypothetical protein